MAARVRGGVWRNDFEGRMLSKAERLATVPHTTRPAPTEQKKIYRPRHEVGETVNLRTPAPPDAAQGSVLKWFRS